MTSPVHAPAVAALSLLLGLTAGAESPELVVGRTAGVVAAISADQARDLAVLAGESGLLVWRLHPLAPVRALRPRGRVVDARLLPGARLVAAVERDGQIEAHTWDLEAATPARVSPVGGGVQAAVAEDGTVVALGRDLEVVPPGGGAWRVRGSWHLGHRRVASGPGGRRVAVAHGDGRVEVHEPGGAAPRVVAAHEGGVTALAFAPGGRWLATGGADLRLRLWDLEHLEAPPRELGTLPREADTPASLAGPRGLCFDATGSRLAALGSRVAWLAPLAEAGPGRELPLLLQQRCALAGGELLAARLEGPLQAFDAASGAERSPFNAGFDAAPPIPTWLAFQPDGALQLLDGRDLAGHTLIRWDGGGAAPQEHLLGLVAVSRNARGVTELVFDDLTAVPVDGPTRERRPLLPASAPAARATRFTRLAGGHLAVVASDEGARVLDLRDGRTVTSVVLPGDAMGLTAQAEGPLLAYASLEAKEVAVWDAVAGRKVWSRGRTFGALDEVALPARGRRFAAGTWEAGRPGVALWEPGATQPKGRLDVAARWYGFGPDGRTLALLVEGAVLLWDTSRPEAPPRRAEVGGEVHLLRWDPPRGRVLLATRGGALAALDLASLTLTWRAQVAGAAGDLVVSGDGRRLAVVAGDGGVELRDGATGGRLATLHRFNAASDESRWSTSAWLAFGEDGRWDGSREAPRFFALARGLDPLPPAEQARLRQPGLLRAWLPGGSEPRAAEGEASFLSPPDGLVTGAEQLAVAWEVPSGLARYALLRGDEPVVEEVLPGDAAGRQARSAEVTLLPGENRLRLVARDLTGEVAGEAALIITRSGASPEDRPAVQPQSGHSAQVAGARFSPDGRRLATWSWDRTVRIWDVRSGLLLRVLRGLPLRPDRAAFSPDGRHLAALGSEWAAGEQRRDGLAIWEVASGRLLRTILGRSEDPSLRWFPPEREPGAAEVTTAAFTVSRVKDTTRVTGPGGALLAELPGAEALAASPDGGLLALASRDGIALQDTSTWRLLRRGRARTRLPDEVAWPAADRLLLREGARLLELSLRTGSLRQVRADDLTAPWSKVLDGYSAMAAAPDGAVALGRLGGVQVFPAGPGGPAERPLAWDRRALDLRWSADGRWLAAVDTSTGLEERGRQVVRLWPRGVGSARRLDRPEVPAAALAFQSRAGRLFAAGGTGLVRLLGGNPGRWHPGARYGGGRGALWSWPEGAEGRRAEHDLGDCRPTALDGAPEGPTLAIGCEDGRVLRWDAARGAAAGGWAAHRGPLRDLAWAPGGGRLATAGEDGAAVIWEAATGRPMALLLGHGAAVVQVRWSPAGDRLLTAGLDGTLRLWDAATGALAATVLLGEGEELLVALPSGAYLASRAAVGAAALRLGGEVAPLDQYDLELNRPDEVLEALGGRDEALVATYRAARERRLRLAGAQAAPGGARGARPFLELEVVPAGPRRATLRVRATASAAPLAALRLRADDVPLPEVPLGGQAAEVEVPVTLQPGLNRLRAAAVDAAGTESLARVAELQGEPGGPQPATWVVAVGVSAYRQPGHDLRFAAHDAERLAAALAEEGHRLVLTDAEATRERVRGAAAFLAGAAEGDTVVVFVAGHGLAGAGRYFFAPHDLDFEAPDGSGLSFDDLEALFAATPARRRLLLLDTCHAGPLDAEPAVLAAGVSGAPGARALVHRPVARASTTFEVMRSLFADLSRGSGAVVISAAAGDQYAFEREGSGVFTGALLAALRDGATDGDGDGRVSATELQASVAERVRQATGGAQAPTFRRDAVGADFPLARTGGLVAAAEVPGLAGLLGLAPAPEGLEVHLRTGPAQVTRLRLEGLSPLGDRRAVTPLADPGAWSPRRLLGLDPGGRLELVEAPRLAGGAGEEGLLLVDRGGRSPPRRLPLRALGEDAFRTEAWSADGTRVVLSATPLGAGPATRPYTLGAEGAPRRLDGLEEVFRLGVAPDGRTAAGIGFDLELVRWSLPEGRILGRSTPLPRGAKGRDAALARALRRAAVAWEVGERGTVAVVDLATGRAVRTFPGRLPGALALDAEGARLAAASPDGLVEVLEVASGRALLSVRAAGRVEVALSPDGTRLVVAAGERLSVWAVPAGR